MFELFRVPWSQIDLKDVEAFLGDAGEEGVTWEAKADDDDERARRAGQEPGRVGKNTIRKAGCGLANQIGGFVILGARWDKSDRVWRLPGVVIDHPEPELWIGQLIRDLRPAPRFAAKAWKLDPDRTVAVVRVEPVDEPPCMTPQGHVYERVSGKTQRVSDPALLDRLFQRGQQASGRAEHFARRATQRAFAAPRWQLERSVSVTVALAPIGRETDEIAARLFVPSFVEAMKRALATFAFGEPTGSERWQEQDAYTVFAHFNERVATGIGTEDSLRTMWFLQATWDGAVAASVVLNSPAVRDFSGFDQAVLPGWRQADELVQRLGGYGPAHLVVHTYAAPRVHLPSEELVGNPQPPAPPGETLYGRLREHSWVQRRVSLGEVSSATLGSIQRETIRALGRESFEGEPHSDGEARH